MTIEEKWSVSMRNDIPEGFDGVYRCKNHPEREVVTPIACRRCQECHELALRAYGEQHDTAVLWGPEHDLTVWGEPMTKAKRGKPTAKEKA